MKIRMGEKTDLQGQKLSDTNNKKKGQMYVMLFVLSFVYRTGERYLNLPKDMMFWKRGSVFVSTENESLRVYLRFIWFESPRPPEML